MKFFTPCILGLAAGFAVASAHATTIGYNAPADFWDRGDADTAYILYDAFASATGSVGPATASGGFSATDLTQDSGFMSGFVPPSGFNPAGITGSGDRIYIHDNSVDFNLTASAGFDAKTAIVQIKQYQTTDYTFNAPTLNGLAADSTRTVSFEEAGESVSITTFGWFDALSGVAISDLELNFTTNPFSFASIDGVQIDVSDSFFVVPEPAAGFLLAGMGFVMLRRLRGHETPAG